LKNFTVYSSSAGSGKTFTLTKEFLKIVLQESDPLYFRHVLAITFTHAATKEMKERLMGALKAIYENPENDFAKAIAKETELKMAVIQARAKRVFEEVINNYSLLSIMTLDAFSSQIVNTFKFDLNLPFSFETLLDKKVVVAEAVKNIFDQIGADPALEKIIKRFAMSKLDEDTNWQNLAEEIGKQYSDYFENDGLSTKDFGILDEDVYASIINQVESHLKNVLKILKKGGRDFMDLTHAHNLTQDDFSNKMRGVYGYFTKIKELTWANFNFETLGPNSYASSAILNGNWYSKGAKNGRIIDGISEQLSAFGRSIIEAISPKQLFVYRSFLKKVYIFNLMKRIENEINAILVERNQAFLKSFGDRINAIVTEEPVPFIYERMGEYYNHILFDEFQDTSNQQFNNILPLLDNALAKGKNSLIVGDEKQSIYSFRGGNAVLLPYLAAGVSELLGQELKLESHQEDQLTSVLRELHVERLAFNYRSSREIIEFNNSFFECMVRNSANVKIKAFFGDVKQEIPEKALIGGFVAFENVEDAEVNEKLKSSIEDLLSFGYGLGDIAILVNNNKEGSKIAAYLNKEGFKINTAEALNIKNRPEINFLMSFLRIVEEPENSFQKFSCLQFFVQWSGIQIDELSSVSSLPLLDFIKFFEKLGYLLTLEDIVQDDFYRTSETLIQKFNLFEVAGLSDFLFCFLDLTLSFYNNISNSLTDFLVYWSQKETFSIANTTSNAITISTIHKSKGLEYPVVFIPCFNWKINKSSKEVWVDMMNTDEDFTMLKNEMGSVNSLPLKNITATKGFFIEFSEADSLQELENMNKIYVAFTRASERLYVWTKDLEAKTSGTVSSYLQTYANQVLGKNGNGLIIVSEGKVQPLKKHEREIVESVGFAPRKIDLGANLKIRFSEYEKTSQPEIVFGKIMHEALEKLVFYNDADNVKAWIAKNTQLTSEEVENACQIIDELLGNEQLKLCFDAKAEIKIEAEILQKGNEFYRPDRISLVNGKTMILDYKTGGFLEYKNKRYISQIKNYGKLLNQMGYNGVEMYIVYFQNFEVIKVEFSDFETTMGSQLNIF
jgi:ATP-dependent helicase/nuclease subunit A